MTETQNPGAAGTATGVPNGVPGQNSFGITRRQRRKQAAAAKPRRRISPAVWSTVRAHIAREHQGLPADSPRLKPTLPRVRWLGQPEEAA
jgi:hypothetical protein